MASRREKMEGRSARLAPIFAAGTSKACADIRESIEAVREAKAAHLLPATRHAMLQVAEQVEAVLVSLALAPENAPSVNAAAQNLQRAAARLGAVANAPEAIAGMAWVSEALQHIGAARVQVEDPQRVKRHMSAIASESRKLTDADRVEMTRIYAERLEQGTKRGAIKAIAAMFKYSAPTIRQALGLISQRRIRK